MRKLAERLIEAGRSELRDDRPSARPRRKLAVLACMDARLDPSSCSACERGDAHIVRNAGGVVTEDALRSLSVSQRLLGTEEVIVVMHRDCGMEGGEDSEDSRTSRPSCAAAWTACARRPLPSATGSAA